MRSHSDLGGSRKLATWPLLAAAGLGLWMLPGALRLRHSRYRRTALYDASVSGVVNVKGAVEACRQSGLRGWDLVTFAQQLVAKKFAIYSTLNLWDPPGRAFTYGTGYCTQYNLALRQILRCLGFEVTAVFATKVRVFDNDEWEMGHTWLRVTVDGETRTVCAGRADNEPGKVHFVPLSAVHRGRPLTLFSTHLGLIFFMGFLEWKALLTRTEPPSWAYVERPLGERQ
jgi:hypothetical protein